MVLHSKLLAHPCVTASCTRQCQRLSSRTSWVITAIAASAAVLTCTTSSSARKSHKLLLAAPEDARLPAKLGQALQAACKQASACSPAVPACHWLLVLRHGCRAPAAAAPAGSGSARAQ